MHGLITETAQHLNAEATHNRLNKAISHLSSSTSTYNGEITVCRARGSEAGGGAGCREHPIKGFVSEFLPRSPKPSIAPGSVKLVLDLSEKEKTLALHRESLYRPNTH